jgi:hypothetical protein
VSLDHTLTPSEMRDFDLKRLEVMKQYEDAPIRSNIPASSAVRKSVNLAIVTAVEEALICGFHVALVTEKSGKTLAVVGPFAISKPKSDQSPSPAVRALASSPGTFPPLPPHPPNQSSASTLSSS